MMPMRSRRRNAFSLVLMLLVCLCSTAAVSALPITDDTFGGRYVSNLIGLEVFDALASVSAPEPATGLLLLAALPGLLLLRLCLPGSLRG